MTLAMGLFTNRAYALAPGLGINAVVAFSLVAAGGLTMPQAMGIVVMEGIVITILVLTGLRTAIFKAIPLPLKKAIAIGIGFFILFIGLIDGGIVIVGSASSTPVLLGDLIGVPVAVTLFGLLVTIIMLARKWKAAILLGILFSTFFAIILNYAYNKNPFGAETAVIPHKIFAAPDFSIVGNFNFGAFSKLGIAATILWVFSLMLSDFFDTMGTLIGVGGQAGYLDKNGDLPQRRTAPGRRLGRRHRRRRRVVVVGHDLHRVGLRRGRRRPHRLGRRDRRRAVRRVDVLLADRRRGARQRHRPGAHHRRLHDDAHPDRGRGHGRPRRQRPAQGRSRASTSPTSRSACRPC